MSELGHSRPESSQHRRRTLKLVARPKVPCASPKQGYQWKRQQSGPSRAYCLIPQVHTRVIHADTLNRVLRLCCRMSTTRQSTLCAIMGRVLDISVRYLPILGSENSRYGCARADGGASVPLLATQSVAAFKLFRNAAIRERSCSMDGRSIMRAT